MEKDTGRYCYEPYQQPPSVLPTEKTNQSDESCKCFGNRKSKSKTRAFFAGLATNLGICVLLLGYTLIGSLVFLAIEGGNGYQQQHSTTQILATRTMSKEGTDRDQWHNQSALLKAKSDEARARTVENIWEITVSLNILYRDNWTRLAAQEITRFQDELLKSLGEELRRRDGVQERKGGVRFDPERYEWTFAKAFLYSLTVLTTIGYGSIAPRTPLGKAVTMGYALVGIPLTLLYLSSVGSILSRVARGVFSRALCCCLCSNCGYCCYDETRMAEKERRMRKRRQQLEMQQQMALQEPFYVRSNATHHPASPTRHDNDKEEGDDNSKSSMHGLSLLAPILLCLAAMLLYICLGTFALYKLEERSVLDGFYFCFMSLTTIGFGDLVPGSGALVRAEDSDATVWFCSVYIMSGMALTAMCFNVVHDEIVHRLRRQEGRRRVRGDSGTFADDNGAVDPYSVAS